jgi:ribonuclease P protein component
MFRFSRANRLRSKHDFQSVFAKPRKAVQKHVIALYQPNHTLQARIGIIIAKHVVKLAVQRNRVRRVIRESFRQHKDALKGLDIIILMRSKCTPLDNNVLREDIDRLWQTLKPS